MKVTVRPLSRSDAGSGVAVAGADLRERLELAPDDFVRVEGPSGEAIVRIRLDGRTNGAIVRVGRNVRRATGVGAGDVVDVTTVTPSPADRVTISLPSREVLEGVGLEFRDALLGRGAVQGQTFDLDSSGDDEDTSSHSADARHRIPVYVSSTTPREPVYIAAWTDIRVSEETLEGEPLDAGHVFGDKPLITFDDVAALETEIGQLRETVELPLQHDRLFRRLDVPFPTGVLVSGSSGTGKTLVMQAFATETEFSTQYVSGSELASLRPDEARDRLSMLFESAREAKPAIVLVDDLDALFTRHEGVHGDQSRVVAHLASLIEGTHSNDRVVVVATTTRTDDIDPSLRRAGRFDREIELDVPDRDARTNILRIHTSGVPLSDDVDLDAYAAQTHGFVGADLVDLIRESVIQALKRSQSSAEESDVAVGAPDLFTVTAADFEQSLRRAQPSALREVFVEAPDVTWADVGGLEAIKSRLREAVQWPLEHPDAFERVDLHPPAGILLYGPPGTGKTLLAKAVANESESNFISVKGPELLDKYVGESERGIREIFSKARENAPTVVFFDEIDAIAAERGRDGDNGVTERVVSQLLTELDGLEKLEDVVVIATTNRPELLDDALLRSGRFDRHVQVPVPAKAARTEIFEVHTTRKPLDDDVDLTAFAERTDGFVGADIESVCREAAMAAVRSHVESRTSVDEIVLTNADFERALTEVETDR